MRDADEMCGLVKVACGDGKACLSTVGCAGECMREYLKKQSSAPVAADPVNPEHYKQGEVECIDAIASAVAGLDGMDAMCTGNAIKYLWRWKHKNGVEDLRKAQWYIERMIIRNPPNE